MGNFSLIDDMCAWLPSVWVWTMGIHRTDVGRTGTFMEPPATWPCGKTFLNPVATGRFIDEPIGRSWAGGGEPGGAVTLIGVRGVPGACARVAAGALLTPRKVPDVSDAAIGRRISLEPRRGDVEPGAYTAMGDRLWQKTTVLGDRALISGAFGVAGVATPRSFANCGAGVLGVAA